MTEIDLKKDLIKIEIIWTNIAKESSTELDAYDYIATQSMTLIMCAFQLKSNLETEILNDKKARLKLQKLHKALENIVITLDFKLKRLKDKKYIEDILSKLSKIKEDIAIIKQYQT